MVRVCLDFLIAYVLALVALIILSFAVSAFLGMEIGSAVNIVPQFAGALYAGQMYVKRTGQRPEDGFAWKAAICMTLTSISLSVIVIAGVIMVLGTQGMGELFGAFSEIPASWLIGIIFGLFVIYTLVSRFFFGMGAKNQIKATDKDIQNRF